MSGFTLQITTDSPSPRFLVNGRGFIMSLDAFLRKDKTGSCHGVATESSITAEVQAADRDRVTHLTDGFVQCLSQGGMSLTVVMNDTVAQPLTAEQKSLATAFNTPPQRLTLKYFKTLAAGSFLMSNCSTPSGGSIFTESVSTMELRADQWRRILACGAAQRTCHVFPNESECRRWLKAWERQWPSPRARN